MKKLIFLFGLVFCIFSFTEAQTTKNKMPINFGIGSSIRMGTLLFPSIDAMFLFGPFEFEGFYKYSDAHGTGLNALGAGVQVCLFNFGCSNDTKIFLAYDRTFTNSDFEIIKNSDDNYSTNLFKQNILCLGIKQNTPKSRAISARFGVSNDLTLSRKYSPVIEFNYCIYFKKLYP